MSSKRERTSPSKEGGPRRRSEAPLYAFSVGIGTKPFLRRLYRMEVHGRERVPATGGAILVANHESLLDPWLLALATPRPVRYMAKAELWRYPVVRNVMEWFGTFPVERGKGDRSAIGRAEQLLADGEVLGVFPQGTCLPYPRRPWHRGAARLALVTGVPVVPVALVDSEKALRPRKPKLGFPRVKVLVGDPITMQGPPTIANAKELTARIEGAVDELRAPYGPPAHVWFDEAA